MERTPIIGITRCSRLDDYVASVERSGGRPRILEVSDSPRQIVEQIDGLVLTGGGDVDPALYSEERHASVQDAEPGRDEFEIDLARHAMDGHLPLLAICRGAQVLNVADGGTLVQDIPTFSASELLHAVTSPRDHIAHDVAIAPGSRLQRALGDAVSSSHTCRVNSRHHQSVGRLGRSLTASATAPDGVIEAIEAADGDFCLGVQWHPENFWRTGEFKGLFDAFVASARARTRA
ncbi:MAG TPA: gamma-glutamyl-gamma-aminobutyrate hydrolase family protein [Vicinamibacterales bacterium]|nr:gamma-glutamyl-gamma-aminobutyrate hydrolase family protein [Vicinamibacterales bacterium]